MLTSTSLTLVLARPARPARAWRTGCSRTAYLFAPRPAPEPMRISTGTTADLRTRASWRSGVYLLGPVMRTDSPTRCRYPRPGRGRRRRHITYLTPTASTRRHRDSPAQRRTRPAQPAESHPRHPATGVVHAELQRDLPQANRRCHRGPDRRRRRSFVDAQDIAAVASATCRPAGACRHRTHSRREALTLTEAAKIISEVTARPSTTSISTATNGSPARGRRGASRVRGGSPDADRNHRIRSRFATQQ